MRFQSWAKSAITASQEKGTSVLKVEFRDSDKELVLPITRMISQVYQSYSNRGRTRELDNVINYLKTQIAIIKPKSRESSRIALDYGYSHGLGLRDGLPLAGSISISKDGSEGGVVLAWAGFRNCSYGCSTKVKQLELQIAEATKAGAGSLYFASQLASLTDKSSTSIS